MEINEKSLIAFLKKLKQKNQDADEVSIVLDKHNRITISVSHIAEGSSKPFVTYSYDNKTKIFNTFFEDEIK